MEKVLSKKMATRNTIALDEKRRPKTRKQYGSADFMLIILTTILTVFGVVMVFSSSYYNSINDTGTPYSYLWSQGAYVFTGFILMYVLSRIDYRFWGAVAIPICIAGLVILGLIFTPLGIEVGGAKRWLNFGLTLMPGEFAKAIMIIVASTYFAKDMRRAKSIFGLAPLVIYTLLVCALIVAQPNLSTAITVFLIAVGIAFVAGMHWIYIGLMFGGILGGWAYLYFINDGYWHSRVASFMDPFADALGDGFQVVQSLLALGTGGLWGKGLGQSVQKNLYLPEPQNDFILAIIGEELGFIGIAALLIVFLLLVWRVFYICLQSRDNFGMLLGSGVAITIGVQVLLNVAVVTSSMPPTGIALPFISAGGNAMWIFLGLIGIVLNISRDVDRFKEIDAKNEREGVRNEMHF